VPPPIDKEIAHFCSSVLSRFAVGKTLRVAQDAGIKTLAMPTIGTGVFKFPPELAAEIIVKALLSRAAEHSEITLVRVCVGDAQMEAVFQATLDVTLKTQT
jgi:O-acetyl-ADP-ribose deacetylase (regulator of RNase III)